MKEIILEEKGNNVIENFNLPKEVVDFLIEKKLTISAAESCTGGLFSKEVTEISGASQIFDRGIVTYSNEAKISELGVKSETLAAFGAVSKETAFEMAQGVRNVSKTDIGISVTGIAGPQGATNNKPVGLVYIGISSDGVTKVRELRLKGNRAENRKNSMLNMFEMVKELKRQY
ncbi:MAG: CinA family protein [Eubacteriales bacterium]